MKTKILADFQICISVRLINIIQKQKKQLAQHKHLLSPPWSFAFINDQPI